MAENNDYDSAYVAKVTCSSSDQMVDLLVTRNQVTLIADGDCFVNFNKPVTTLGRFFLKANVPVTIDVQVSTLHYLTASATPAIYIVATRL
jgi:hypothetical protein